MVARFSSNSMSHTAITQWGLCSPCSSSLQHSPPTVRQSSHFILTTDITQTDLSRWQTHIHTLARSRTVILTDFCLFFLFFFENIKITPQRKTAHLCNQNSSFQTMVTLKIKEPGKKNSLGYGWWWVTKLDNGVKTEAQKAFHHTTQKMWSYVLLSYSSVL